MRKLLVALSVLGLLASTAPAAAATQCRDAKGKFVKCSSKPAAPKKCRDARATMRSAGLKAPSPPNEALAFVGHGPTTSGCPRVESRSGRVQLVPKSCVLATVSFATAGLRTLEAMRRRACMDGEEHSAQYRFAAL